MTYNAFPTRFSYLDTLKIVERSGPGAVFYGHGRESDIDDLDNMLARKQAENPSSPPILALYTECPSNPRLHTVNMPRLRELADRYNFLIVIDETIGSFANVDVLPYADIIITSLSKFVSGYANTLGGRYAPFLCLYSRYIPITTPASS